MIGPGAGARVMVATRPVDFRKGPDALTALVGAEYGGDPYSGVIYVLSRLSTSRIPRSTAPSDQRQEQARRRHPLRADPLDRTVAVPG